MGCHFLLQGILPTQGSNLVSHIGGRFFIVWDTREAQNAVRGSSKEATEHKELQKKKSKQLYGVLRGGSGVAQRWQCHFHPSPTSQKGLQKHRATKTAPFEKTLRRFRGWLQVPPKQRNKRQPIPRRIHKDGSQRERERNGDKDRGRQRIQTTHFTWRAKKPHVLRYQRGTWAQQEPHPPHALSWPLSSSNPINLFISFQAVWRES